MVLLGCRPHLSFLDSRYDRRVDFPQASQSAPNSAPNSQTGLGPTRELPLRVEMKLDDYFRLEMKNILLSIVTLGIYSAWAKVRRRKYFTQNTYLDGHNFDYTANPKIILRSRILVFAVWVATVVMQQIDSSLELFGTLALFIAAPWAIASSAAFNLRNTRFAGRPFSFHGSLKQAYVMAAKAYGLALITLCSLTYFVPMRYLKLYVAKNTKFNGSPFDFEQPTRRYVELGAIACVAMLLLCGLTALALFMDAGTFGDSQGMFPARRVLIYSLFTLAIIYVMGALQARLTNLSFNGLSYENHRFSSKVHARTLGIIYLTNTLAIVLTFGLAIPWAYLRSYKYRMSKLKVIAQGPLFDEKAPVQTPPRAPSDAIGDAFMDLEMDFGI